MLSIRAASIIAACSIAVMTATTQGHGRIHAMDDMLAATDLAVIVMPTGHQAYIEGPTAGSEDVCDVLRVMSPILSRGVAPAEGEYIFMYRGSVQGDSVLSTGHTPALEQDRPYLLLLSDRNAVAGSWNIVAGDQGAFRLVADESGSGDVYPMRFDRRGIVGLTDEGLLTLTPSLDAVVDGLAIPSGGLDARMTVAPTPVGQGAISAETRQPWAGDEIYTLPGFLRMLATIDVGDAASVGTHHHLADGTVIASEVSTMATRGGITDLCVCNRAELFLTFDTLPSSFWAHSMDNHSMWTYNQFMDIFRVYEVAGWAGSNGINEFGGFTSDANMQSQYNGYSWPTDTLAVTCSRTLANCECCWFIDSDVHYNPRFSWKDDIDDTFGLYSSDLRALYRPVAMHELGHTWGYMSQGGGATGDPCPETYNYEYHSVMHGYYDDVIETGRGLHLLDAMHIRSAYDDQTVVIADIDVGCESYYVDSTGALEGSFFYPTCPDANEIVTLYNVVMENMTIGWSLHDLEMRVYLSKNNHTITESDRLVGTWSWSELSDETWWEGNLTFTWPDDLEPDLYYIGIMMYLPQEDYSQPDFYPKNNTTWMDVPCPGNPEQTPPVCTTPTYVDLIPWTTWSDLIWIPYPFGLDDNDPPLELCCGSGGLFYGPDLWYEVIPPANGLIEIALGGNNASDVIALYEAEGACSGASPVACICETGGGNSGGPAFGEQGEYRALTAPVQAGTKYLIRVGSLSGEPAGGNFHIGYRLEGIPGDTPHLALPLDELVYGSLANNSIEQGPAAACSPDQPIAEWYTWVSPANGVAWATTCDQSTSFDTALAIFNADDCPGSCSPIACNDNAANPDCGESGASYVQWEVTAGEMYLIRVAGRDGDREFVLRSGVHADSPSNDSCDSMVAIVDGLHPYSTLGATEDSINACDQESTRGVWYKYVAATEGFVTLSTCPDLGGDANYESQIFAMNPDQCESVLRCSTPCGDYGATLSMWVTGDSHPILLGGSQTYEVSDTGSGDLMVSLDIRCIGDVDGQGDVGIDDLLLLIGGWGGIDPLLDFSNDGIVGIDDLLAMLDRFGCSTP